MGAMGVGGAPKIPAEGLYLEGQTRRSAALSPMARRIVHALLALGVIAVVAGFVAVFVD
jgi:hypothetical protein